MSAIKGKHYFSLLLNPILKSQSVIIYYGHTLLFGARAFKVAYKIIKTTLTIENNFF